MAVLQQNYTSYKSYKTILTSKIALETEMYLLSYAVPHPTRSLTAQIHKNKSTTIDERPRKHNSGSRPSEQWATPNSTLRCSFIKMVLQISCNGPASARYVFMFPWCRWGRFNMMMIFSSSRVNQEIESLVSISIARLQFLSSIQICPHISASTHNI